MSIFYVSILFLASYTVQCHTHLILTMKPDSCLTMGEMVLIPPTMITLLELMLTTQLCSTLSSGPRSGPGVHWSVTGVSISVEDNVVISLTLPPITISVLLIETRLAKALALKYFSFKGKCGTCLSMRTHDFRDVKLFHDCFLRSYE